MMSNTERFQYVNWALDNFPEFVTSPDQYRASQIAWEERKKARVFDAEYLMSRMRSEDLVFPAE